MKKLSRTLCLAIAVTLIATSVFSADTSILRTPPGAKVAIIVFEDMECPSCAITFPLLQQAVATYKIPLVHYDFPLAMHAWSLQAAVNARWFESKSKKLATAYRGYVFEHQSEITKDNLTAVTQRFAASQKVVFPLFVDPKGELAAKVRSDFEMGRRLGIEHTPTVYVVSNTAQGPSVIEFRDYNDVSTNLYTRIDEALKTARSAPAAQSSASKTKSSTAGKSQ